MIDTPSALPLSRPATNASARCFQDFSEAQHPAKCRFGVGAPPRSAAPSGSSYVYDGPRQPNGDFLENLKVTENLRFCDFSDPAEIYGKFTEKLPKTTEIKQQIMKKKTKSGDFQNFFVILG